MHSDIDEFRLRIRAYLTSLGVIGSLSFSIYQLFTGDTLGSFLSFMCGVYFGLVVYLLIKHRQYLWEGRGYAIFLSVTLLNLIKSFPEYGIYWAYVWVTYIFLLMRFKEALFATGIFIPLALYFVNDHYPTEVLIRIYATLFLVGVYAIVFSSLIERLLDRVNILITQDPLTKALNRSVFYNSVETALFSFRRYNIPTSLFLFDLDHFKKINDDYGHLAGDRVLEKMSECVRTRLRQSDQFFRYGGEEFAILLTNTLQEDAMLFAEDIRKLIKDQDFGIGRHVTISGGVSQACSEDEVNTWIDRCDKALYQAKLRDRNRVLLSTNHTKNG